MRRRPLPPKPGALRVLQLPSRGVLRYNERAVALLEELKSGQQFEYRIDRCIVCAAVAAVEPLYRMQNLTLSTPKEVA